MLKELKVLIEGGRPKKNSNVYKKNLRVILSAEKGLLHVCVC